MKCIIRNSIEYLIKTNDVMEEKINFKDCIIQETLTLTHQKPDIKQVIKVYVEFAQSKTKIDHIPTNPVIIEGDIKLKLEYISKQSDHPINVLYFTIPICQDMDLLKTTRDNNEFCIMANIQDIYVHQKDPRNIFVCIYLILNQTIL